MCVRRRSQETGSFFFLFFLGGGGEALAIVSMLVSDLFRSLFLYVSPFFGFWLNWVENKKELVKKMNTTYRIFLEAKEVEDAYEKHCTPNLDHISLSICMKVRGGGV